MVRKEELPLGSETDDIVMEDCTMAGEWGC